METENDSSDRQMETQFWMNIWDSILTVVSSICAICMMRCQPSSDERTRDRVYRNELTLQSIALKFFLVILAGQICCTKLNYTRPSWIGSKNFVKCQELIKVFWCESKLEALKSTDIFPCFCFWAEKKIWNAKTQKTINKEFVVFCRMLFYWFILGHHIFI